MKLLGKDDERVYARIIRETVHATTGAAGREGRSAIRGSIVAAPARAEKGGLTALFDRAHDQLRIGIREHLQVGRRRRRKPVLRDRGLGLEHLWSFRHEEAAVGRGSDVAREVGVARE